MSERVSYEVPGPRFSWNATGGIDFAFVIDPRNVLGPRPATPADREKHPDAWALFELAQRDTVAPVAAEPPVRVFAGYETLVGPVVQTPDFEAMSVEALRAWIAENGGAIPHHRSGHATLVEKAKALL